jgi:ketosteroid isomerase-like protein
MSANFDLVRSIYEAWERGDYRSADWAHPEIEFVIADGPSPGSWTGRTGMAEAWGGVLSAWEDYRHYAAEYRELDEERVLVLTQASAGRGKTSGLELSQMTAKGANVFHIRDGKVTRLVLYFEGDHALADLGLVPEAGPPGS